MIYLSGRLKVEKIGQRLDIGIMLGYREGSLSHGRGHLEKVLWAADNGCFTNPDLNVDNYIAWLTNLAQYKETCLFATAPDVVGDSRATWERSKEILPVIRKLGYPAALVVQDGIEAGPIKWDDFDCLFIGGSTEWKLSTNTHWLCREAIKQGKWVHMGRVNSFRRMLQARFAGCHSCDGTQLAFAPDKRLEQLERWLDFIEAQPVLNF
jgi:hypothetical protein